MYPWCCGQLNVAVDRDLLPKNPTDGVTPPRVEPRVSTVPTLEELRHLLTVVAEHRLAGLWMFLALSGLRKGEALGLQWPDIEWEAASMVDQTVRQPTIRRRSEVSHKSATDCLIPGTP